MRSIERRVLSELLKHSRRNDRDLARSIGVSQPTIRATIKKLEREGIVREYTILPDFHKLGFDLMALTFLKLNSNLGQEEINQAIRTAKEVLAKGSPEIIMLERGIGMGYQGVIISLHIDYTSYLQFRKRLQQFPFLATSQINSFLIDLQDDLHYRYPTLSTLAKSLLKKQIAQ